MKVSFQYGLGGYTGKADDLVYCYHRKLGIVYARKQRYPKLNDNNVKIGATTRNLHSLKPSEGYKNDLRTYIARHNALKNTQKQQYYSWVNLYLKLMADMAKSDPAINLLTLSREYVYVHDLPCINVKKAVEAGLLIPVYDYQSLTKGL